MNWNVYRKKRSLVNLFPLDFPIIEPTPKFATAQPPHVSGKSTQVNERDVATLPRLRVFRNRPFGVELLVIGQNDTFVSPFRTRLRFCGYPYSLPILVRFPVPPPFHFRRQTGINPPKAWAPQWFGDFHSFGPQKLRIQCQTFHFCKRSSARCAFALTA